MKKKISSLLLILIFLIGLSLLLYPMVSDFWNTRHQTRVISDYQAQVGAMDADRYQEVWNAAEAYNQALRQRENAFTSSEEQKTAYEQLLNIGGTGLMGYVEIPSISVKLPIYHGTDQSVLQIAAGHVEWSSLPVGGEGTHSVLSGHRGLPSATLLTHLDRMAEGDIFQIRILDEVLIYQVDQIMIVEPENIKPLLPEEGKDLCTLVTCTPYGINSHRLLVRGHRIDQIDQSTAHVAADAVLMDSTFVALVAAVPLLLAALVILAVRRKKK